MDFAFATHFGDVPHFIKFQFISLPTATAATQDEHKRYNQFLSLESTSNNDPFNYDDQKKVVIFIRLSLSDINLYLIAFTDSNCCGKK